MVNKIEVAVNSIRLEENSDTPIMILSDPLSNKVLPIWIGTIEAVSIAYAQEGILHERPPVSYTHLTLPTNREV